MVRETNLIDLSKVTLENYITYNEHLKYEVPRQWGVRNKVVNRRIKRSEEEKKQYLKEYQHKYYMEVTKIKREKLQAVKQLNKEIKSIKEKN